MIRQILTREIAKWLPFEMLYILDLTEDEWKFLVPAYVQFSKKQLDCLSRTVYVINRYLTTKDYYEFYVNANINHRRYDHLIKRSIYPIRNKISLAIPRSYYAEEDSVSNISANLENVKVVRQKNDNYILSTGRDKNKLDDLVKSIDFPFYLAYLLVNFRIYKAEDPLNARLEQFNTSF